MIRSIFVSALFFFGPALLMFMLRNMFLFLRAWLRIRRAQKRQEAEVIDITPHEHGSPSVLFYIAAIAVGLVFATMAWQKMSSTPEGPQRYTPAHMDEQGKITPGKMEPEKKSEAPKQ